jgi:alpha/beta superfamily hydrolase
MMGAVRRPPPILAAAVAGGALLVLALGYRFGAPLALSLALALPATGPWLGAAPEPAPEEVTLPAPGGALRADLYRPAAPRGAILLVHGLSAAGRRQPDLARLAGRLARHGQLVLVPDFDGLRAYRLSGREVDEVRAALDHVRRLHRQSAVAGFSFGAGPALLAAAGAPGLRLVASFGGYADLRHVIGFLTTGLHEYGGRRYTQPPEEYNRWKLLALLVGFVEDAGDRRRLEALAARRLADPGAGAGRLADGLGAEGRAVLALVENRRPEAVAGRLDGLPAGARAALARLSPLPVIPQLAGRLLVAHGAQDPSIPFTESLRLAAQAGGADRAVIFRTFHHTGPLPLWRSVGDHAGDAWRLLGVADALLR